MFCGDKDTLNPCTPMDPLNKIGTRERLRDLSWDVIHVA